MICPKCGKVDSLVLSDYYQISHDYRILKNGKVSKRFKRSSEHTEEWSAVTCNECGSQWSSVVNGKGGFYISDDGTIVLDG